MLQIKAESKIEGGLDSEEMAHDQKQMNDGVPSEASEAIGKAAIPLPWRESAVDMVKKYDEKYLQASNPDENPTVDENGHRYVGLVNQAMTCYLNSLIQTLYMTPEFRNGIYSWKFDETTTNEKYNSPFQLQKLFLLLQTSDKLSLETKELTASFGWKATEAFEQRDVQELCRIMFEALEHRCRYQMDNQVQDLYKGIMEDYVKCLNCGTENVRKDVFMDLSLAVKQFGASESFHSIEEALSAFTKPEVLSGNNKYQCSVCASQQDAQKGLRIVEFPYLLTIQLKRFDFDYQTLRRIKLNDRVTFPDYLDLNDFVELPPASPPPKPSYATMAKKPKTDSLMNSSPDDRNHVAVQLSIEPCSSTTPDVPVEDCSIGKEHWSEEKAEYIAQLLTRGKYIYELVSIMVHQGSASAGHYFAYIKNLDQKRWFCFNDSSVQSARHCDILSTFGGNSSGWTNNMNAYMLMYRQIDSERNQHFTRSTELPEHLSLLREELQQKEEELRIREEASSVRITFKCSEEHCCRDPPHSQLFHMSLPIDLVFDQILAQLNSAEQLKTESGEITCPGCDSNGGHSIKHEKSGCQRLILCNHDWVFQRVIADFDLADVPLVEGTGDDALTVVGGDDPNKRSLSSVLQIGESFPDGGDYEINLLVETKTNEELIMMRSQGFDLLDKIPAIREQMEKFCEGFDPAVLLDKIPEGHPLYKKMDKYRQLAKQYFGTRGEKLTVDQMEEAEGSSLDISSYPGTPEISPMVSAAEESEGDGHD